MKDRRRYARFRLNDLEVNGKMVLANEVKIIDISISGISLKADRRLNMGSDYTLKLEGSKTISLKGTVVWCSLSETRNGLKGDTIPIYSAGIQFKNMSTERIAELQDFIENHKIEAVHVTGGAEINTRLNIRFHIKDPENTMLIYPDNYKVDTISLGGMLIECSQKFDIETRLPMEIFIHDDDPLKFVGRVASSKVVNSNDQEQYRIGIEFLDLTGKDRKVLASFIDHSFLIEPETKNRKKRTDATSSHKDIPAIPKEFIDRVDFLCKWHKNMGYYKMLDIKEYASDEQIRHAFIRKTHELHPDKFPAAPEDLKRKLNTLFAYLNVARETLLDPQKRKEYDKSSITRLRY